MDELKEKIKHHWAYLLGSFIGGVIIGIVVILANKGASSFTSEFQAQNWESEKLLELALKSDRGLFFVVSYNSNGTVDKQIICSHVRKDPDLKEVVCEEYGTGDFYIFYYPVTITNVTLARDYIKLTNSK